MARRFSRGRFPAKKIHTLRWAPGASTAILGQGAGAQGAIQLVSGAPAETILRIRGWFSAWLNGAQAPGISVQVTAGLILVPEGTGSTVIWDPFADTNAPWIWYTDFALAYEEGVIDTIQTGIPSRFIEVDSKAMRKASPDEELQFVVTNTTLGSASQIDTSLGLRILLGH